MVHYGAIALNVKEYVIREKPPNLLLSQYTPVVNGYHIDTELNKKLALILFKWTGGELLEYIRKNKNVSVLAN